jgi:hypothetical protein
MLWHQNAYRENLFLGRSAYGWYRALGQALRCWGTEDGGTVCTDLMYYAPDCPTAPAVTEMETLPTPPEAAGAG